MEPSPSPEPQRSSFDDNNFRYFVGDYWDIFLGLVAATFAIYFHTLGDKLSASIAASLAIVFISITVSEIAEILAERLDEPYGSFVLTFTAVAVEILLLFMILLQHDTSAVSGDMVKGGIISAVIVDMNLLLGLSVLIGGLAYKKQTHNEETSGSYTTILLVTACVLLVPSILALTGRSTESIYKVSVLIGWLLLAYYVVILIFQTKTHITFFKATARSRFFRYKRRLQDEEDEEEEPVHYVFEKLSSWSNFALMFILIVAIGFLAEVLGSDGVAIASSFGISAGVAGLFLAFIAVAPEFFTSIRAARNDETQRVINIAMGASTVTIMLTVPILIFLAYSVGIELSVDFNALEVGALIFTVLLAWKTTQNGATDYLEGISHLVFFAAYVLLAAYY